MGGAYINQKKGVCDCEVGWQGLNCSKKVTCNDVNNCTDLNHGICFDVNKCVCYEGFGDSDCSRAISCSKLNNCSGNGFCESDNFCSCNNGWTGMIILYAISFKINQLNFCCLFQR